jgi:uncharacterized membrane protein (UPF0127 family)
MVNFNFELEGKKFNIEVEECKTIFQRASGLMFRKKSKPLLFIFPNENKQPIHSFFCKSFIAIWFNKDKIVDVKIVKPWKISVIPNHNFDKLLEIPDNDIHYKVISRRYRNL